MASNILWYLWENECDTIDTVDTSQEYCQYILIRLRQENCQYRMIYGEFWKEQVMRVTADTLFLKHYSLIHLRKGNCSYQFIGGEFWKERYTLGQQYSMIPLRQGNLQYGLIFGDFKNDLIRMMQLIRLFWNTLLPAISLDKTRIMPVYIDTFQTKKNSMQIDTWWILKRAGYACHSRHAFLQTSCCQQYFLIRLRCICGEFFKRSLYAWSIHIDVWWI